VQTEGMTLVLPSLDLLELINSLVLIHSSPDSLQSECKTQSECKILVCQVLQIPCEQRSLVSQSHAKPLPSCTEAISRLSSSPTSCATSSNFTFFRKETQGNHFTLLSNYTFSYKGQGLPRSASFYTFSILQGKGEKPSQDQRGLLGEQSRWMATKTQKRWVV